jgi:hypothetical protein
VNRARLAAAACGLLLLAACDVGPYSDAAQSPNPVAGPSTNASTRAANASPRPVNQRPLGDGLTVTISAPRSFTPTDAAIPRAPRAVAFELIIHNEGDTAYRPSNLSITATANGVVTQQVVDSTQGYTGFVGATDDVPPGESVRVIVAFAMPVERAELRLMVLPDSVDGGRVTVYEGTV